MCGPGRLTECLLESDSETRQRARRLRREALALSIALECFLVAGVFLWPLLMPGALPARYVVTPVPPYPGGNASALSAHANSHPPTRRHTPIADPPPILQPPHVPLHIAAASQGPPLEIQTVGTDDRHPGDANSSPVIPGATGNGPVMPNPPRPPEKPTELRRISEGVMEAALIHRVEPQYPATAKIMHLSGTVELRAIIGTDGSVRNLTVLSGNPILVQAALAAVRRWRYRPTQLDGQAVEVETYVTVNFVM